MQVSDLLKSAASFFDGRETAVLDAEVLLAHALGVDREFLVTNADDEVDSAFENLFQSYLGRVRDGEPVAYISQEKEFFGNSFYVDDRVLIPRPETEHLVEKVIEYIESAGDRVRMLDIGTGSGNIAISVAKYFFDQGEELISECLALEYSPAAIEVARVNVEQHGLSELIQVVESDLLEVLEEGERYDIIVANLPYIGEEKNRFVSAAAEKYEPNLALFGGSDGLQLYQKMFEQLRDKRIEFEFLIGEFGFAQGEDLRKLLDRYFLGRWEILSDLVGIERMFIIKDT